MNFDYTLYLVTDRQLMSCDSLTEAVEQAILELFDALCSTDEV